MTQPALDFFTRRAITAKIETTEGTDATPTTSANGILLMNSTADTSFDKKTRPIDRTFFTSPSFAIANKYGYVEGDFELFAPATPGQSATQFPACDPLLQCAGMAAVLSSGSKTTTYHPISSSIPSMSTYFYHSGLFYKFLGARNNISSIKQEIGSICTGKVHIQGNYTVVTETALPAVTTYATVPVVCTYDISTASVQVGAGSVVSVLAKSLEIIFGNNLASKEYTTAKFNSISDRQATWNMRIARTALADFNPWATRDAGSTVHLKMRTYETGSFGVVIGLYTELQVNGQIEQIKEANIDDDYGWDLSGSCIASSAGGDDFQIVFGDNTP